MVFKFQILLSCSDNRLVSSVIIKLPLLKMANYQNEQEVRARIQRQKEQWLRERE